VAIKKTVDSIPDWLSLKWFKWFMNNERLLEKKTFKIISWLFLLNHLQTKNNSKIKNKPIIIKLFCIPQRLYLTIWTNSFTPSISINGFVLLKNNLAFILINQYWTGLFQSLLCQKLELVSLYRSLKDFDH